MESRWRWNVVEMGWEDVFFAGGPFGDQRWQKLAILTTPVVLGGQLWYSVGHFGGPLTYQPVLTKARLLGWVDDSTLWHLPPPTGPFPYGFNVLPDHP